ncbi:MAG: hypothetical protein K9N06_12235 [Candidatus Cloacimonetes bacterium]|nr:hypothetical protein [Candidatus Cloacimonadota bacterium]
MRKIAFIFCLVLLLSCSEKITRPDFDSIIRDVTVHYAHIYPNPSNGVFAITFNLLQNAHIKIVIVNSQNEIVRHLVDRDYGQGSYTIIWDGEDDNDHDVCSGIYNANIYVDGYLFEANMCLVK